MPPGALVEPVRHASGRPDGRWTEYGQPIGLDVGAAHVVAQLVDDRVGHSDDLEWVVTGDPAAGIGLGDVGHGSAPPSEVRFNLNQGMVVKRFHISIDEC